MSEVYAKDFSEIESTLKSNYVLKNLVLNLAQSEPIIGKVVEDREEKSRQILLDYFKGNITYSEAVTQTEKGLPRGESKYSQENHAFASGWAERHVKTQISRFYNHAVLKKIISSGSNDCYIHHSQSEDQDSKCTRELAGKTHSAAEVLKNIKAAYSEGNYSETLKVPYHPHCSHTVYPVV
ncbi:hypothetical protein [Algicola sagamiensis]|uniref:hypothetical protein n=1 Tax=Algicola sagamiensis TaxID=163869 RepID=UPI0003661883|nr:hypothetical protein [Algicola sagamiensis]